MNIYEEYNFEENLLKLENLSISNRIQSEGSFNDEIHNNINPICNYYLKNNNHYFYDKKMHFMLFLGKKSYIIFFEVMQMRNEVSIISLNDKTPLSFSIIDIS